MANKTSERVLVLSLNPYHLSTRSRKAAVRYRATTGPTTFLGLSGVGRTGRWGTPGAFAVDGIAVTQLRVRRPRLAPTRTNQVGNLVFSYTPALLRMCAAAMRSPATVVHVGTPPLILVALLHHATYRSRIVLDIPERPGAVTSKGSLAAAFSRFEIGLLRCTSRYVHLATVVVPSDVGTIEGLGFRNVRLVRNAPLSDWRAPYIEPPASDDGSLDIVVIGTIFEGRGFETLLRAVAIAARSRSIHLRVYGPGRPRYLDSLRALASSLGLDRSVDWMGRLPSSGVSAAYLQAHAGLVLYESSDPGNDGLSNKILECVSTGRPVIAGDLPENRAFVSQHRVGWLTPVTVEGLAHTLAHVGLGEDPAPLAAHCRACGDTWLNWESEFQAVLELIAK